MSPPKEPKRRALDRKERRLPSKIYLKRLISKRGKKGLLYRKRIVHMRKVNRYAVALGKALNKKGLKIDLGLVDCASLSHDLFKGSKTHESDATSFFKEKGYPDLATSILMASPRAGLLFSSRLEDRFLAYADSRFHLKDFMSLDERRKIMLVEGIPEKEKKVINAFFEELKEFEKLLKAKAINPDKLIKALNY
ncbi:MAG: hypothetical protein ABIE23_02170 [archaeon]|nr:hypothetical protein [Candidatus Micrarchaeota archaeon]